MDQIQTTDTAAGTISSGDMKKYLSEEVHAHVLLQKSLKSGGTGDDTQVLVNSLPMKKRKRVLVTGEEG